MTEINSKRSFARFRTPCFVFLYNDQKPRLWGAFKRPPPPSHNRQWKILRPSRARVKEVKRTNVAADNHHLKLRNQYWPNTQHGQQHKISSYLPKSAFLTLHRWLRYIRMCYHPQSRKEFIISSMPSSTPCLLNCPLNTSRSYDSGVYRT